MPASEDTPQERLVARVLNDTGLRYIDQHPIDRFFVDFWIPEINTVVEADGIYGHFRKRDRMRDTILIESGVARIWHVKSQTLKGIEEEIWQALKALETEEQRESPESSE
jgi:very-short-patch-repair endonuclease